MMKTQLERLESGVSRIIRQCGELQEENSRLKTELQNLQARQQDAAAEFEREREENARQNDLHLFNVEQNFRQTIDQLKAEKFDYETVMADTAARLETLLQRFPEEDAFTGIPEENGGL